jgi:hypothetical protein
LIILSGVREIQGEMKEVDSIQITNSLTAVFFAFPFEKKYYRKTLEAFKQGSNID